MQKRQSEITHEENEQYEWESLEPFEDDPLCIRGLKHAKLPPAPDGMEWIDVTAMGDSERKYVLGVVKE